MAKGKHMEEIQSIVEVYFDRSSFKSFAADYYRCNYDYLNKCGPSSFKREWINCLTWAVKLCVEQDNLTGCDYMSVIKLLKGEIRTRDLTSKQMNMVNIIYSF